VSDDVYPADPVASQVGRGEVLTAVSDGIVALLKDFYGKGPTRDRLHER